jgi:hypothetical protein
MCHRSKPIQTVIAVLLFTAYLSAADDATKKTFDAQLFNQRLKEIQEQQKSQAQQPQPVPVATPGWIDPNDTEAWNRRAHELTDLARKDADQKRQNDADKATQDRSDPIKIMEQIRINFEIDPIFDQDGIFNEVNSHEIPDDFIGFYTFINYKREVSTRTIPPIDLSLGRSFLNYLNKKIDVISIITGQYHDSVAKKTVATISFSSDSITYLLRKYDGFIVINMIRQIKRGPPPKWSNPKIFQLVHR